MNTKLKALLWEECRTGGVIAGWIAFIGLMMFAFFRLTLDSEWMCWDDFWSLSLPVVYMAGFGVALLQILSVDYSGRLSSGFSRRVLNLPVETRTAVFAALVPRTLFVASAILVLWAAHNLVFPGRGSAALVLFFVLLYLAAQLFDWLRHVVSGLTSLAGLVGLLLMLALFAGFTGVFLSPLHACLLLSCEFFETGLGHVWKRLVPPAVLFFLAGAGYCAVLYLVGG